jgi:hypothetical protein
MDMLKYRTAPRILGKPAPTKKRGWTVKEWFKHNSNKTYIPDDDMFERCDKLSQELDARNDIINDKLIDLEERMERLDVHTSIRNDKLTGDIDSLAKLFLAKLL